jgi:hypothetical protein
MTEAEAATTLWRPTGLEEPAPVAASGRRARPPRLPGQPVLRPVPTGDAEAVHEFRTER